MQQISDRLRNILLEDKKENEQSFFTGIADKTNIEIVVLFDQSGSMTFKAGEVINVFNKFLQEQKKDLSSKIYMTGISFSNTSKIFFPRNMIQNVEDIRTYPCAGGTALYDTMAKVFNDFDGCTQVILFILSDGEDLDSTKENKQNIKQLINTQKEKGWNFIFMTDSLSAKESIGNVGLKNSDECVVLSSQFSQELNEYNVRTTVNSFKNVISKYSQ